MLVIWVGGQIAHGLHTLGCKLHIAHCVAPVPPGTPIPGASPELVLVPTVTICNTESTSRDQWPPTGTIYVSPTGCPAPRDDEDGHYR